MRVGLAILAGMTAATCWAAGSMAAEPGPFSQYEWHRRLLVVFAPSETDHRFIAQLTDIRRHTAGYLDRELTVFSVVGDGPVRVFPVQPVDIDAAVLRDRFGVGAKVFRAILVGKDGDVKLTEENSVGACRLFGVIDGMPRRRQEMAERGGAVHC